jgi:hypothetical protein
MACKDCGKRRETAKDLRVFTFPFGRHAGVEIRTWGPFSATQVALVTELIGAVLAGVLVDLELADLREET